jgi:hypothetical protein
LPRSELEEQLAREGFHVQVLAGYGEQPFPPGLVGFLATKPAEAPDGGPD